MPMGVMGRSSLAGANWLKFTAFNKKEGEGVNTRVCCSLLFTLKHLRLQSRNCKNTVAHNTFRPCFVRFYGLSRNSCMQKEEASIILYGFI